MLFQQLINAVKWVFKAPFIIIEKAGEAIADAEERVWFGDKDESNKK